MSSRAINFLRITMIILMVLSVGLLLWQHFGMTRILRIDTQAPYAIKSIDDRAQGGASVGTFAKNKEALQLQCDLKKNQYQWPFCEMSIEFSNTGQGIDLSQFDRIVFDMDLRGPDFKKVRVYLRNFEEGISKLDDPLSAKVNELEFAPVPGEKFSVPLKYFRVASWWIDEKNVPVLNTDMRLDNITQIEIATPGIVKSGAHEIEMRSLEFHGKWLSLTQVLTVIVAAWLLFCFAWLLMELLAYRERDQVKRARMNELETINRVLEIQAEVLTNKIHLDPLTGALNREGLRDFLLQQWKGEMPTSAGMSVLFADLDHFKRINDNHGHAVGDEVLRRFAKLVQSEIRGTDALVRWGGEEFLVVCPNTDLAQSTKLAEKLRASVANATWPNSIMVTCSCGVATRGQGEEFSSLIERADTALYKAKDNSRNRVELG